MSRHECPIIHSASRAWWRGLGLDDEHLSHRVWRRRVSRFLRVAWHHGRCPLCDPRGNPKPAPEFAAAYRRKTRRRNRR